MTCARARKKGSVSNRSSSSGNRAARAVPGNEENNDMRIAAVTLITVFALSAAGQVRESVNVEVVQVPVYVTTSAGTPVPNLTKDAFQLFVDGRPQPIEYFDAVD